LNANVGVEGEEKNFWEADKLPKELRAKLKDFPTFKENFGRMVGEYAQSDDLRYIIKNAPTNEKWKGLKGFAEEKLVAIATRRLPELLKTVKLEKLKITARYSQSIDALKKAAKFYGYVNSDINDRNFKEDSRPDEKKEAILVHIGQNASTEEVEAVKKHLKLRPGNVKETLSLTIDHPNKQREFPIVETGSSWQNPDGHRNVAYLYGWHGRRDLNLYYREGGWGEYYRFLAFRESK
jgi:hypothetical protein